MTWKLRPKGHADIDSRHPEALGVCDRCGSLWNLVDLNFQKQYRGAKLRTENILVCQKCNDTPARFLVPVSLTVDPVPVKNPRPEFFNLDE